MQVKVRLGLKGNAQYFGKNEGDVVTIPFEDYVKGVVAAEIQNAPIEACKAQAVAARTFAYVNAKNGRTVGDTANDGQVFIAARIGNVQSYPNAIQAVEETKGEVLTYGGKNIGINCHFSSANNGTTKNKKYRWPHSSDLPYLVMRPDPWTEAEIASYRLAGKSPKFGHGVGMSQYGARYAAVMGIGYLEILDFYYPGTVIVNYITGKKEEAVKPEGVIVLNKGQKIIDFSRRQVGEPYSWGARGPDVWDCSGLTKMAAQQIGLVFFHGATTQWNRGRGIMDAAAKGHPEWVGYFSDYGETNTAPRNKVLQLFNRDKNKPNVMAHTGWYDPLTGNVIQAGGYGGRGVHENPVRWDKWTHWATIKGADEEADMSFIPLRKGSVGLDVRLLQTELIRLGHYLGKWGADGKFGGATEKGVREFQEANGLPIDGVWKQSDQEVLDEIKSRPPIDAFPDIPMPPVIDPADPVYGQDEALALLEDALPKIQRALALLKG